MNEVEEVLEQAKDALARHRDWMSRRRVQRTVVPSRIPATHLVSEEYQDEKKSTTWAVGSPSLPRSAPPPLKAAPEKRVTVSSNQIAPAVDSTEIDTEKKGLSPILKPIFVSHLEEEEEVKEEESKKLQEDVLHKPHEKNPSWLPRDQLSNGHGGGLLDVELSDEEGYQYGVEVKPESSSPPPYVMSTIAWGEQESLRGPLFNGNKMEKGADQLTALKSSSMDRISGTLILQYPRTSDTPPTSLPIDDSFIIPPIATSMAPPIDTSRHQSINVSTSPSPLSGDNSSSIIDEKWEDSDTNEEHYRMLRESSSARIVTVSPAPREQRTTFSAHTMSKVSSADAAGSIYDYNSSYHALEEELRTDMHPPPSIGCHGNGGSNMAVHGGEVPGASIKMVLPGNDELERSVNPTTRSSRPKPVLSSRTVSEPNHGRYPEDASVPMGPSSRRKNKRSVTSGVGGSGLDVGSHGADGMTVTDLDGSRDSEGNGHLEKEAATSASSQNRVTVDDERVQHPDIVKEPVKVVPKKTGDIPGVKKKKKKKQLPQKRIFVEEGQGSLNELPGGSHRTLFEGSSGVSHESGRLLGASEPAQELGQVGAQASVAPGDDSSGVSAPLLVAGDEVQHTDVYVDGSWLVRELPPLKSTSLLPALMAGMNVHPKRRQEPPGYEIHQPKGGLILSPPCPLYGEDQPKETETLKKNSRWHSGAKVNHSAQHATRTTQPLTESQKWDRPVWSRSKSAGVGSSAGLGRSSSTLVLNEDLSGDDQSLMRATSERNVSELAVSHAPHASTLPDFSPGPGPLHLAAKLGNLRRLQALLDQGHDVDMPDEAGRTPLMYCIQADGVHLSCADALIQYGANLDKQTSDGATVVHIAAAAGALSILELLLLNHAQPNVQDFEGRCPIHWATLQSSTRAFTLLLNRCGPGGRGLECVDDAGMTVLMWAAYHDNHRIVSYLMDQGADTEEKDKDGYTAMHWAIHREGSRSLQLLLKPDMTYFKDHLGKTLMHVAAEKGSMAACEVVLKLRPDAIHDRDKKGRTPLHYGAACSRVDVCALLLDYGADASQKDIVFKTALDYAREKRLDYVVALLSCHGNAVADFARASRSVSVSSLLNRSISFSQLPTTRDGVTEDDRSTASTVTIDNRALPSPSPRQLETPSSVESKMDAGLTAAVDPAMGGYMGRFFPDDKDLVKHYFFRLNEQEGSIAWSRSREGMSRTSSKVLVLDVHREPSNTVRSLPKFSPSDLHYLSFWIGTSGGVLDLLAYNEDAYNVWLLELERVAGRNANLSRSTMQGFKGSSVHSRPVSSLSSTRQTARVSMTPRRVGAGGVYDNAPPGEGHENADTSVFMRSQNVNDDLASGYDVNRFSKKVLSKNVQVIPLASSSTDSSPPSSRRSELSFVGETFQSGRPTSLLVDSRTQGTVI